MSCYLTYFLLILIETNQLHETEGVKSKSIFNCCRSREKINDTAPDSSAPRVRPLMTAKDPLKGASKMKSVIHAQSIASKLKFLAAQRRDVTYQSCRAAVRALPWSIVRRETEKYSYDQFVDILTNKYIKRWKQLSGEIAMEIHPDPWWFRIKYLAQKSMTKNVVMFNLDTLIDRKTFQDESDLASLIKRYNERDLAFHQPINMESGKGSKTIVIYRKGLMDLLYAMRSGIVDGNTFEFALYGDVDDIDTMLYNAVIIEMYYNEYRLWITKEGMSNLSDARREELQFKFKFVMQSRGNPNVDDYDRVIFVDSGNNMSATLPQLYSSNKRAKTAAIKVAPFEVVSQETSLRDCFQQRNNIDLSLIHLHDAIMDIDQKVSLKSLKMIKESW